MDRSDQAHCNQPSGLGLRRCIVLAFALVGTASTALFSPTDATSAESLFELPVAGEPLQAIERSVPTAAWIRFCQRQPQEWRPERAEPAHMQRTPAAGREA